MASNFSAVAKWEQEQVAEIPAPGQQLHGPVVDLLVAGDGIGHGFPAFVKGRGSRMMKSYFPRLLFQRGSRSKTLAATQSHNVGHAVAFCIGQAISTADSDTSTAVMGRAA